MRNIIYFILISLLLFGCSRDDGISNYDIPNQPGNTGEETYDFPDPVDVTSYDQADAYANEVDEAFIDAQMDFAFKMFNKIIENNIHGRNIVYSPLSTSMALTMLYNGAEGETKRKLQNVLCFDELTTEQVNEEYRKLLLSLSRCDTNVNLGLAGSLWLNDDVEVNPRYNALNKAYFLSETHQANFIDPTTLTCMNEWVAGKTQSKVRDLIKHDMDEFSAVLMDAFAFNGKWTIAFNKDNNDLDEFHLASGGSRMVEYMRAIGRDFSYLSFSPNSGGLLNGRAIRIPYGRDKIGMYILLPDADKEPEDVLMFINSRKWQYHLSEFKNFSDYWGPGFEDGLLFELPKFKIDYTFDVKKLLEIENLFYDVPHFNRMTNNTLNKLSINQKSHIEIDETGLENEDIQAPGPYYSPGISFNTNRPFIFIIQDDRTNIILQMGMILYV